MIGKYRYLLAALILLGLGLCTFVRAEAPAPLASPANSTPTIASSAVLKRLQAIAERQHEISTQGKDQHAEESAKLGRERAELFAEVARRAQSGTGKAELQALFREMVVAPLRAQLLLFESTLRSIAPPRVVAPPTAVEAAKRLQVRLLEKQTPADGIANRLNQIMREAHDFWHEALVFDDELAKVLGDFVILRQASDLPMIRGWEPLRSGEQEALMQSLAWFAVRIPDGEIASELRAMRAGTPSPLFAALGKTHSNGEGEQRLVRALVNDLVAAFGEGMQPTRNVRKDMVRMFSERTTLTFPHPMAMVFAILGSVVLFGGLALSITIAMRSSKKV